MTTQASFRDPRSTANTQEEFYSALLPLSNQQVVLSGTTYKIYPGGCYGKTDPAVERIQHVARGTPRSPGAHFDGNGQCLSDTLMRYRYFMAIPSDIPRPEEPDGGGEATTIWKLSGWNYVRRDSSMEDLPASFWLLEVHEGGGE